MLGRRIVRTSGKSPAPGDSSQEGNVPLKRKMRSEVVSSGVMAMMRSPLLAFVLILSLTVVAAIISEIYAILIIPLVMGGFRYKLLLYEFFLALHVIESGLGIWTWYHLVDTDLYLGGLPLQTHYETFIKKLRIGAVLSIVEGFELTAATMVGLPVSPAQWKSADITHMQLSSPDWFPPPIPILDQGADFINTELSEGRKVYCHCKSGVGRSACVIAAYFIKYKRMDAEAAQLELISKRSYVFKKNSRQMKMLKEYEQWLRGNK